MGNKDFTKIRFKESALVQLFGTTEKLLSLIYNIVLVVILVITYILYGLFIIDSFLAFIIGTIVVVTRVLAYLVEKLGDEEIWAMKEKAREKRILFIIEYIVITIAFVMVLNLIFDFRLWNLLGIVTRWIDEVAISINIIFGSLIALGVWAIYTLRDALKKTEEPQKRQEQFLIWMILIALIVVPALLIFLLIPIYMEIDLLLYDGFIASATFEGQAIDDWFAYVFYILFQAPIPAFMIAFMALSTVAVLLSQNLQQTGAVVSGVAMAVVAIVPLLLVFATISGSVPPPPDLVNILGLSKSIASFIYGMGLIITYVISISIMGVFIGSSRALIGEFGS